MRLIALAAAFAFAATAAFAGDDVLASRYGNTTITKDANGVETHIYYAADHSFTGKQNGMNFKGTWAIDDKGNICLTFDQTMPGTPNPACAPVAEHKVGDTWSAGPYTVSIVAGIQ